MAIRFLEEEVDTKQPASSGSIRFLDEGETVQPQQSLPTRDISDIPVGQLTPGEMDSSGIRFSTEQERELRDKPQILQPEFKELVSPIIKGASTAAFGIPEAIARRRDKESAEVLFAEQQTPTGKALNVAGQAAGLLGGGAASVAKQGVKLIPKGVKGSNIIKSIVGGATFAALQLDKDATFKTQLDQSVKGAGIGALFGLGGAAIGRFASKEPQAAVQIAKLRDRFFGVKRKAVDAFGAELDDLVLKNPTATIDIRDTIDEVIIGLDDLAPKTKSILMKVPELKKVIKNPQLLDDLGSINVKQVQGIANKLNETKNKSPELLDVISDLKAAQLEAFPQMAEIRNQYRTIIEPFNNLKSQFKFNRLENAIKNNFGGIEGRGAVKELLGPNTIKELGGLKKTITKIQRKSSDVGLVRKVKDLTKSTAKEGLRFFIFKKFILDNLGQK